MKIAKILNSSILFILLLFVLLMGCESSKTERETSTDEKINTSALEGSSYTGSATVSQGPAVTTVENLFPQGVRVAAVGVVVAEDGTSWVVPSEVNYTNDNFPTAPDLYNPYGEKYNSAAQALSSYDERDIVVLDSEGELITAYIFGDNYFELYIDGIPVAKDAVPFTGFNSHLVLFKVNRPFTIAMKLVDWEENLGLGSENNRGKTYHPGDGGMVAVFKDDNDQTIGVTNHDWKAQTYYTAPVDDLSHVSEEGNKRLSTRSSTEGVADGTGFYALHWSLPDGWMNVDFDDTQWPQATTFTNDEIGVNNKPAYTKFTDIFDDNTWDSEFIWSTNVVLDNEVLVRYTIE